MARRRKGDPVHGWVCLDKPLGMGSTEAVSKVKWLFQAEKAGHAGTLDPLASGMLPIALGEATKTVGWVMDGRKTYRFTIRWGAETTTDDLEGEIVRTSGNRPSGAVIEGALDHFRGEIEQIPLPDNSVDVIISNCVINLSADKEETLSRCAICATSSSTRLTRASISAARKTSSASASRTSWRHRCGPWLHRSLRVRCRASMQAWFVRRR